MRTYETPSFYSSTNENERAKRELLITQNATMQWPLLLDTWEWNNEFYAIFNSNYCNIGHINAFSNVMALNCGALKWLVCFVVLFFMLKIELVDLTEREVHHRLSTFLVWEVLLTVIRMGRQRLPEQARTSRILLDFYQAVL